MNGQLMRVRDFAQRCGCTPQNVYGHLRTYAEDLAGHTYQGRGRQGVLLDDYAQEFLRSVMTPREVADSALMDEINMLRGELLKAGMTNASLATKLANVEAERDRALLDAGQFQKQLTASREEEEARKLELEEAQFKLQEESDKAANLADEKKALEDEKHLLEQQLKAERERNQELENRTFGDYLKGLFRKKEKKDGQTQ